MLTAGMRFSPFQLLGLTLLPPKTRKTGSGKGKEQGAYTWIYPTQPFD